MPEFTYIASPMPFVSPWVTSTTFTSPPVRIDSTMAQTSMFPQMGYFTYTTQSVPTGTFLGYIDPQTSEFNPAQTAEVAQGNMVRAIAGWFLDGVEAVAEFFGVTDDGWGEDVEYEKYLSPSGLIISPAGSESLVAYARAAISNEAIVPNNRIILDLQSSDAYEGDVGAALADLSRLADETGVIICVKLPFPPYVHEFVPAVMRANAPQGIAWALGVANYQIENVEVIGLIRKVFLISRPFTYGDLLRRFGDAGVPASQLEKAQSVVSSAHGQPLTDDALATLIQAVIDLLQKTPKSATTKRFRYLMDRLPEDVQIRARETYQIWRLNPSNTNFRFKSLTGLKNYWSIDVAGTSWKAVALKTSSGIYQWIFVGSHEEYNNFVRLLKRRPSENGRP